VSGQRIEPPTELRPSKVVGVALLFSREGQVWRDGGDGKPKGPPIPWQPLQIAQQQAKRDPQLRRAYRDERGRLVHGSPVPLVFDQDGQRFVRFVHGWRMLRGHFVPDPIPLHGDEHAGWVSVRGEEGLLVFHAPSVALGLFENKRDAR
jgi:hypothetical protein